MHQLRFGRLMRLFDIDQHCEFSGIIEGTFTTEEAAEVLHVNDLSDIPIADIHTTHFGDLSHKGDDANYATCSCDREVIHENALVSSVNVMSHRIQTNTFDGFLFLSIYSKEEWERREAFRKAFIDQPRSKDEETT